MSEASWCDITTEDAESLVAFYELVMGWKKEPVDMGGYNDYVMMRNDGTPVGGICHKKGVNASLPGGWINYFTVESLSEALANAIKMGGEQVGDIRHHGSDSFCIIIDPSGAPFALYEKGEKGEKGSD
ncbi:VOC family protein [Alteromonas sp. McT4-15]|uniref:VOC family protein n=1 Tax=Alteromonas sp. McT4-15 TaxID=2881256 RepID=UPI001CF918CB|nr:VOC family protein [Alteromonas sp. McT4-15]MCB4436387.1 VOC family protein [Alteromonas sp. McT4-15]